MSRIRLTIDQLILHGIEPADRGPLLEGLQTELARVLADPAGRAEWARSHRTPVLKLGRMALEPGPAGGRRFGTRLGGSIGRGLVP